MSRWLALPLTALALGCAAAPEGPPREAAPEAELGPAPKVALPVEEVVSHDPTKRTELLPPPLTETEGKSRVPTREEMEKLIEADPVAFVTHVVARYDREVKSYRCTLEKQERVKDKLLGVEVVECHFREQPFSVRMDWKKGATQAARVAFVKGENKGNLLVLPEGRIKQAIAGVVERDPEGAEATSSSRYPVTEFGIQVGTRRTLDAWRKASKRGDLKVVYGGVKKLRQLNGRPAWEVKRVGYPAPEDDGITEATFYFDVETWLQTGSYLTGEKGKLIASYYFRDVEPNPELPADTFTKAGLKKR